MRPSRGFIVKPELSLKTDSAVIEQPEEVETGGATHGVAPVANAPQLAPGHSAEQQEVINYAWEISNGDMRFIYLLTAENGEYTYKRTHPKLSGTTGTDYGLCGINSYYHPNIINDDRFFTDMHWQLEECYRLYQGGTTFYGIIRYDRDATYRQKIHNKFQ